MRWHDLIGCRVRLANGDIIYCATTEDNFGFGGMEHAILLRRHATNTPPFEYRDQWAYHDDLFPQVWIQAFALREEMLIDADRLEFLVGNDWKLFKEILPRP